MFFFCVHDGHVEGEYTFGVWFTDPTGMTIASGGIISDPDVAYYSDFADPQWCEQECAWGFVKGEVDPLHVYAPSPGDGKMDHKVQRKRSHLQSMVAMSSRAKNELLAIAVVMLSVLVFVATCRYCQKYERKTLEKSKSKFAVKGYRSMDSSVHTPCAKRMQL